MTAAQLRAVGVAKRFGRSGFVLEDVEFELAGGTLTEVVGRNGSGKSTLLRLLAGLTLPTRGRVVVGGRRVMVPERFVPPAQVSASSYLRHMGRLQGLDPSAVRRRSGELLERLGAAGTGTTPLGHFSKGTVQKVAIAQAFLAPAGVVLLDEPHAGLDDAAATALGELISEARGSGAAVLYCEHEDSRRLPTDQALMIHDGHVRIAPGAAALSQVPPVLVRLSTADGDRAASRSWNGTVVAGRDGELLLHVPAESVNEVLLEAIAGGWEVREVRPEHEASEQGRPAW